MFKRLLSLIIITTLMLGVLSMSFAEEKAEQITSEDNINSLLKRKIITVYNDGTIILEKSITREEFSSVLAKIIPNSTDRQKVFELIYNTLEWGTQGQGVPRRNNVMK